MPVERVVIVGAGQAGCQVASSLRDEGFDGSITLLGDEDHPPYQRPPLSKGHLTGAAARDALFLRPETWFADQRINLRTSSTVTAIDREGGTVRLADGGVVGYDTLVLALGSRHRPLAVDGRDLSGVVALRTLTEADDIKDRLERASSVVVVGGGFIGMEVAATAAKLGKDTTVLELTPQLMGRVLSATTAEFLADAHRRRGLTVELGTSLSGIVGHDGHVTRITTSDGRGLAADLVLLGVGAEAEITVAEAAGLKVDNGIVVDEHLRSSDPDILAVGDCAAHPNPFAEGRVVRLESVQNATAQGRCAAATIVGKAEPFCAVPWFWSDQADLKLQIAGLTQGHDDSVLTGSLTEERFSVWCFRRGVLIGVESVNRAPDHMAARKLLADHTSVTADDVRSPGFDPKAIAKGR